MMDQWSGAELSAELSVDLDVLTAVVGVVGGDPVETRRALIDAYLGQADGWISDLVAGAAQDDAVAVRAASHALTSSSQLLGATRLAGLLTECGLAARSSGMDLRACAGDAADEYARVSVIFRALGAVDGPAGADPDRTYSAPLEDLRLLGE